MIFRQKSCFQVSKQILVEFRRAGKNKSKMATETLKENYKHFAEFFELKNAVEGKNGTYNLTFKCLKCLPFDKRINSSTRAPTSNLKLHIETAHNGILSKFLELRNRGDKRKSSNDDSGGPSEVNAGGGPTPSKVKKTASIFNLPSSFSKKELNEAIKNFIINGLKPFSIVREEAFRELIRALKPNLAMPTAETIKKLMDEDFDKMLESIKSLFEDVDFVALSTDGWKSVNRAFLGKKSITHSNTI